MVLNVECTKQLYFSFIHSYLNYANIAWASTNKSKLKKILNKQKHASRIIYFKDKFTSAAPLMQNFNVLNIYQLNTIYQVLLFMHKVKNHNISKIFEKCFKITFNKYNTKQGSFLAQKHQTKTSISRSTKQNVHNLPYHSEAHSCGIL